MSPTFGAQAVAHIATGLIAGIFLGHRAGVSRAARHLDPGSFVQLQQIMHQVFQRMMPPLVLAAVLGTLTWTFLVRTHAPVAGFWLLLPASASLVSAAVLTRAVNMPINRRLMTWNKQAPPVELRHIWDRWERIHSIRTLLVIGAFACQTLAAALSAGGQ